MHEYKQYPQAWSILVHLRPHLFITTTDLLCHQFSLPLPFLCVTTQEDI